MATPAEKLAEGLKTLHSLQEKGIVAIKSAELARPYRERLINAGFIKEVTKGWYIPCRPDERPGDSTYWYGSYWDFCSRFLHEKYGNNWIVSPEQSVQLNAENWVVPKQLIVRSTEGSNYVTALPHGTSLLVMKLQAPDPDLIKVAEGIRMYNPASSLTYCSANTFTHTPTDARTTLAMIRDASELLPILLEEGHTTYAGRLAGAFRNIGKDRIADDILSAMKTAGYDVRETSPFTDQLDTALFQRERSPYITRLRIMWHQMREVVLRHFPSPPGLATDQKKYLQTISSVYITDAYHSLSIERYRVSPELIERVRNGQWDHAHHAADEQQRNAMAAKGYWEAFQEVKESIEKILAGQNAGQVADMDHGQWYRKLFQPSVTAGILKATDLAGYRNQQVYIGGSQHVPLNVDAVRDVMPVFFELLAAEPEASVRSVLGHFVFVFIHPYMDGNGRIGRFLMNAMLSSGGYPWTVIPVERRDEYMQALESASVNQDIEPFTKFLGHLVEAGMKGEPVARI